MSDIREMTELEVRLFTEMNKARDKVVKKDAEIERLRADFAELLDYAEDAARYLPEWAEQKWGIRAEIQKIKAKREGK